jgi:carboxyl-terminal processing protease
MTRQNLQWLLAALLISLVSYRSMSRNPQARQVEDVLEKIQNYYVEDPQNELLGMAAISGVLKELDDPNSSYIRSSKSTDFQNRLDGVFGGIGIEPWLDPNKERLVVQFPLPNSPAAKAGIRSGDEIVKIDGEEVSKLKFQGAIQKIRGTPGSELTLTIKRAGQKEPLDLKPIARELITETSVVGYERNRSGVWSYRLRDDPRIAYIRLTQFGKHTTEELREVLTKLKAEGFSALVLDLRGNPGGYLHNATEITNFFLGAGEIVRIEGRNPEVAKSFRAQPGEQLVTEPMVVLIDRDSASASEIVAAALMDHERATIIGERSFGKGTVQHVLHLPPRGDDQEREPILKLTVAYYFRPNGHNIHRRKNATENDEWGVTPLEQHQHQLTDDESERLGSWQQQRERRGLKLPDPAAENVKEPEAPASLLSDPAPDPHLRRALEYLRTKMPQQPALAA